MADETASMDLVQGAPYKQRVQVQPACHDVAKFCLPCGMLGRIETSVGRV
jgi:hypothetical protein